MSNLPYPDPNNSLPYPTGNVPGIPQFPIAGEMPMPPSSNYNQGFPQQSSQLLYRGPSARAMDSRMTICGDFAENDANINTFQK